MSRASWSGESCGRNGSRGAFLVFLAQNSSKPVLLRWLSSGQLLLAFSAMGAPSCSRLLSGLLLELKQVRVLFLQHLHLFWRSLPTSPSRGKLSEPTSPFFPLLHYCVLCSLWIFTLRRAPSVMGRLCIGPAVSCSPDDFYGALSYLGIL